VPIERIDVPDIPRPLAHYTPAVRAAPLVFAAGQIASDYRTGVPPEAQIDPAFPYYGSAIKKQTRYVLENLARTFRAAGTSLEHVVKAQIAFFFSPNVDSVIECLPSCVGIDNPPRYPPAVYRDLVLQFYNANYFHRKEYAGAR
jgi:enamine deaminase RidA (YjgF/YER057c/UK114 family)